MVSFCVLAIVACMHAFPTKENYEDVLPESLVSSKNKTGIKKEAKAKGYAVVLELWLMKENVLNGATSDASSQT